MHRQNEKPWRVGDSAYTQHGAETGRLTSKFPNVTQLTQIYVAATADGYFSNGLSPILAVAIGQARGLKATLLYRVPAAKTIDGGWVFDESDCVVVWKEFLTKSNKQCWGCLTPTECYHSPDCVVATEADHAERQTALGPDSERF